ncbi:glutamyl-tRNA amidotransferase subunit A [Cucurbitaria berberidis CBS 394.84]|uniref:Glutamyl-tRNA amidotransferase subunit A n=1 Tax=Cucurbitaria berberidis CBS 394.84 TaxID=1168544 RepID=A0A9P4L7K3_9PLEO|nr:glutamyl-tRNA amidotransferase subunit A [Cucurbitaria berberidis CBS 394.84]KAF1844417.1 glutamyl-tRNA amidotransferase subunit A [Cucurbitaria berberidis CBS 394.84]
MKSTLILVLASSATSWAAPHQQPCPYDFPCQEASDTPALFPVPTCVGVTLEEATIDQLQGYLSEGLLTSVELLKCYLKRARQVDGYINSIIELNPDAEDIATALDAERAAGRVRGPLHGIPFIVKDNIATKDQMETTAGSWVLLGSVVPRDAHVVAKLRQAGALLMGKATLSEWADMRSSNYSEGYSPRGGQARSPYNLTVNPGGSSSGSAAAVAANVVPFSIGTETDGSVINPAERNALIGIKPTVGLTSRAGVIPESIHQDTIGTFGRTVRDAAYAIDAIYGIDTRDNYTLAQESKTPLGGYAQFLVDKSALPNATFGLPWNSFWVYADEEQQSKLLSLITMIQDAGATVINNTELPSYKTTVSPAGWNWDYGTVRGYQNESEFTVVKVDFYNNIKAYLSELKNTHIRSLEDIVAYNYANDGTEGGNPWPLGIPAFYSGQDSFLASLETRGVMNETYYQALAFTQRSTREEGIDAALANNGRPLDALLVPPDVGQTYQVAAQAGYPMITLPAGVHSSTGMPFGLALMGTAWSEASLLKWASAIEDLQLSSDGAFKRTLPNWYGYLDRNIPVRNL